MIFCMDDEELLDLVDAHDNVIRTINRGQTGDDLHEGFLRSSDAFIKNSDGQLWVPRRQKHKKIAPGGLDYSVSGHVGAGQTYKEALFREAKEELNLKISPKSVKFIKKFAPGGAEKHYFRSFFIIGYDEVPPYNTDDFSQYYWLTPQEFLNRLQNGEPAKRSLAETVAYLIKHGQ
jgi:isopentenyldiphosphate isomerase